MNMMKVVERKEAVVHVVLRRQMRILHGGMTQEEWNRMIHELFERIEELEAEITGQSKGA